MQRPRIMLKMLYTLSEKEPTKEEIHDVYVLAWIMELLQFGILACDDIVDDDLYRRGRRAWHRQPGVGPEAVYDTSVAIILGSTLLKTHFQKHPSYMGIHEAMTDELVNLQLMQSCDTVLSEHCRGSVYLYNRDQLRTVSLGKCGYYYLPIVMILQYLGLATKLNIEISRDITSKMAIYYQGQNDFLNLFGGKDKNGKAGSDIPQNKCSWLIVEALERCNAEQRDILYKHYGQDDNASVEKVKTVFFSLDLEAAFKKYQQETLASIDADINALDESGGLKREVFQYYMELLVIT